MQCLQPETSKNGRKQEGGKNHYFLKQEVVKGLPISWLCELGQIEAPPQLTNGKFLLEGEIIWTNSDSGWLESIQMQAATNDKNLAVFQCLPSEAVTQWGSNIRAGMLWATALFTKWMFYVILRNLPEEKQQKQNKTNQANKHVVIFLRHWVINNIYKQEHSPTFPSGVSFVSLSLTV